LNASSENVILGHSRAAAITETIGCSTPTLLMISVILASAS
jgi:hypothetical protein